VDEAGTQGHLGEVLVLLLAAVAAVGLFHRLRVSPVLGYLGAGVLVGPSGLGLVRATEDVSGLAEFGVIFLLFAVGLDLPFRRLRAMWRHMLVLGLAQVALTSLAVGLAAHRLGLSAEAALVVGGALALSSTATVLQLLRERHELVGHFGRVALGVLLLQDLAVVPLLALLPLLAVGGGTGLVAALGLALGKAAAALAAIMLLGGLVLRPLYRAIAGARNAEILTAANLLIVLGAGWATAQAGMSMALGAFLAGILLAETEYRHQVEADIQPFRGLLLGLFFLTVGMGIDLSAVAAEAAVVGGVAAGLLAGKAAILAGLALLGGLGRAMAVRLGLSLAQGGEFAFVILGLAERLGVLPGGIASPLVAAVVLTMAATPPLHALGRGLAARLQPRREAEADRLAHEAGELEGHVVLAGYGRIGGIVARLLTERGAPFFALDLDPACVKQGRRRGVPVYLGDASRPEVLRAAGAERAAGVVVTLDQPEAAERVVQALRHELPDIVVVARGRDAEHGRRLAEAGAAEIVLEALEPGLRMAGAALRLAGAAPEEVNRAVDEFRRGAG
jgi:monovalent cation:H+ antiporter-2, CPA2 family